MNAVRDLNVSMILLLAIFVLVLLNFIGAHP